MAAALTMAAPMASPARRPRIVIVGAGFAGIAAARALRRASAEVLLIDRRNHHVFQPLLYQAATAILAPGEIAAPIRAFEARQPNLDVILGEVTSIDVSAQRVDAALPDGSVRPIAYDYLVIASGSRPSYFGHDEFARFAPGLKSLTDAEAIRSKILRAFEVAETTSDPAERGRQMTFVLVGAGPTGVELAASLSHMVHVTLRRNFRRIDPSQSRIVLLDAADRVLPTFAPALADVVAQRLTALGVELRTSSKVERVDEHGVVAAGTVIPAATVLWTAGVAASPLARMPGGNTDRAGRAQVDHCLRVEGLPQVFVVGDAAAVTQGQRPVPGVAQAAIQEGRYVGRLIAAELAGRPAPSPFRYFDKGNMAVVGKNFAVLERGALQLSGFLTWLLWACVHILTLPLLQNRIGVQSQWLWSYFSGQRSSRLISEPAEAGFKPN